MDELIAWTLKIFALISANYDVIVKSAGTGLTIISVIYSILRWWGDREANLKRRKVLEHYAERVEHAARHALPEVEGSKPERTRQRAGGHDELVNAIEAVIKAEGRRASFVSLWQNFFFFVFGTVVSLIFQKYPPF